MKFDIKLQENSLIFYEYLKINLDKLLKEFLRAAAKIIAREVSAEKNTHRKFCWNSRRRSSCKSSRNSQRKPEKVSIATQIATPERIKKKLDRAPADTICGIRKEMETLFWKNFG